MVRHKCPHMDGKPDLRFGIAQLLMNGMDEPVGAAMAFSHHLHHPQRMGHTEFTGREPGAQIAADGIHIRLIDGHIFVRQVTQIPHRIVHHGKVLLRGVFAQKATLPFKPHGVGEVMQRQQHMDAVLAQQLDLPPHLSDLPRGEFPLFGLQSCPFQPKAVVPDAHFGHQAGILLHVAPVVGSYRRVAPVLDATLLVPVIPVAVPAAAVYLGGGSSGAQCKILRKAYSTHSVSSILFRACADENMQGVIHGASPSHKITA